MHRNLIYCVIALILVIASYKTLDTFGLRLQGGIKSISVSEALTHDSAAHKHKQSVDNVGIDVGEVCIYSGIDSIKTFKLREKVFSKALVLRFSGNACDPCLEFIINTLKRIFPDYPEANNILLVTSDLNARFKMDYFGKPVFSFCGDELGLPFEKQYTKPFFFILDRSNKTQRVFVPDLENPQKTVDYLEAIKEIL